MPSTSIPELQRPDRPAAPRERFYAIGNKILARGVGRQLGDHAIALVCPTCGNLWGRVFPADGDFSWWASVASCPTCPHGHSAWYPAGSFLPALRTYAAGFGSDYDWPHNLPPEILRYEAVRHLARYEYVLRSEASRVTITQ